MYFLEFKTKVEVEMVVGFSPRHYVVLLRSLQLLDYPNVFLFVFYMTQVTTQVETQNENKRSWFNTFSQIVRLIEEI